MQDSEALKVFEDSGPTLTAREARRLGLHWEDLYRLRDNGAIVELSRGVFRSAQAPAIEFIDVLAVLARAPRAVACLNTAASIWNLTDEIPSSVHIAVPRGSHRPRVDWPTTTVHVFAAQTFELGRTSYELDTGESIIVYSPERTVVDLVRLGHRQSSEPTGELVRRYLRERGRSPAKLLAVARELGAATSLRRLLEIVAP